MAINYEEDLKDPNVLRFLDMLIKAEGNAQYNQMFGRHQFNSFADHPRQYFDFTDKAGVKRKSSASGAFQITADTYDDFKKRAGVSDFSPQSQAKIALAIIDSEKALDDIKRGDFKSAIGKLGGRWASLPTSKYAQPKRSWEFVSEALGNPGGLQPPPGAQQTPVAQALNNATPWFVAAQEQANNLPELNGMVDTQPYRSEVGTTGMDVGMTTGMDVGSPTGMDIGMGTPFEQELRSMLPKEPVRNQEWKDDFIRKAIERDVNEAKARALAQITGNPYKETMRLPSAIDNMINLKVSEL